MSRHTVEATARVSRSGECVGNWILLAVSMISAASQHLERTPQLSLLNKTPAVACPTE